MKRIINFIKISLLISLLSLIISFSGLLYVLWRYSPELPDYDKIVNYKPNLSSRVYTADGKLLQSFFIEERIYVPINRIPKKIILAFLSSEDKNFYNHFGIDLFAIFRAVVTNFIGKFNDSKLIGASTITQQVVKNILLSSEVSYERKIKEILLAIRIERILSKNQILELYLNDIYLGYGSYGIASASLNYFDKSINELNLSEIAFLAALPKAPNNYNPINKYQEAIQRRNWVIDRMYQNGFILKEELISKNLSIDVNQRTESKFTEGAYFYEEIRKNLYKDYGKDKLYSDGLIIKTTIDTELQKFSDYALINGLIEYDKRQGWRGVIGNLNINNYYDLKLFYKQNPFPNSWIPVVIIDSIEKNKYLAKDKDNNILTIDISNENNKWLRNNKFNISDVIFIETINDQNLIRQVPEANGGLVVLNPQNGDVLSLSGGFSYNLSEFNRVTQAKRQPGSAFKPFVYITALKEGFSPSTLILDAPYVVDQGPGLPKWKPANYTEEFYGLTTMRTGVEKSRNLMTIRLADKIGIKKILLTTKDFKLNKFMDNNLSMSLGSGLVTLLDITNAYGMIVNGGKEIFPHMINSIYSKEGKQIYSSSQKECQNCKLNKINTKTNIPKIESLQKTVLDDRIAYQVTSMLEGVVIRGTARKLKKLNLPLAGKTGTTNDNKDAWFIGFSPDLVVGIYIGNDNPKSLGYKETGSSVAVPIFKELVLKAKINNNKIPFRIPSGLSFVSIDPNTGLPSNQKNSILEPYLIGTEPFNKKNINILDSLGSINNDSISGTGGLLNN